MATRKHNEYLDADQSDDGQSQGYDSENDGRIKGGRSSKRRKVDSDASENEDRESDIEDNEDNEEGKKEDPLGDYLKEANAVQDKPVRTSKGEKVDIIDLPGVSKPLSKKNLVATTKAVKKSGVVYLSRIPPFMKPSKLRSLLEPYGAINRIFMNPEDPVSHTRRVRNGGNKKKSFSDGWVEFVNKADAKTACELLNARTIGGKKGTYYHDDVWNLLYLSGFKWNNLTEQIATENAERSSRLRAEIAKTTKDDKEYVQNIERAKMLEGMEAKKAAKRREKHIENSVNLEEAVVAKEAKKGNRRLKFQQRAIAVKDRPEDQPDQVKRVLSKIF